MQWKQTGWTDRGPGNSVQWLHYTKHILQHANYSFSFHIPYTHTHTNTVLFAQHRIYFNTNFNYWTSQLESILMLLSFFSSAYQNQTLWLSPARHINLVYSSYTNHHLTYIVTCVINLSVFQMYQWLKFSKVCPKQQWLALFQCV